MIRLSALLLLASFPAFAADPEIRADIVYGHKDGLAMTMDMMRPANANGGAVLFMVSGGWVSKWAPPQVIQGFAAPFLKEGFTFFAVRHGSSPRYGIPDAVSDVRRAVRYVRMNAKGLGIEPDRLGVMGMSAGGHLSLVLGTTGDDGLKTGDLVDRTSSRVNAVVAVVPPTDLRVCVWEAPESLPAYKNFPALDLDLKQAAEYSPLVHVSKDDAPALILVGGKDALVPPKHGHWIAEAMKKGGVSHHLIEYPDGGHDLGTQENRDDAFAKSVDWFRKQMK